MIAYFGTTSGEQCNTGLFTFEGQAGTAPKKVPELDTPYGGTVQNAPAGGSLLGYAAGVGVPRIVWKTASNAYHTSWRMNDVAALTTALADMASEFAGGTNAIVVKADGTVTVVS